jgi:hypothetical protein
VGPFTCTERLLVATKQLGGSLPKPATVPQRRPAPLPAPRESADYTPLGHTPRFVR